MKTSEIIHLHNLAHETIYWDHSFDDGNSPYDLFERAKSLVVLSPLCQENSFTAKLSDDRFTQLFWGMILEKIRYFLKEDNNHEFTKNWFNSRGVN